MINKKDELQNITGAGGKNGGSSGATEAQNTAKSKTLIRVLEVISEGECKGLVNGAQGIFFNNTALQNSDNTYNFNNVAWAERVGLPEQTYMEGFPSAQAEYAVGTDVTNANPGLYTVTSPYIDAVRLTIAFPYGLTEQSMSNGNITGSNVDIAIDIKLQSVGVWETVTQKTVKEKTTSAYECAFRVERPIGEGVWNVRVRRITADPSGSNIRNQFQFARVVEIQDVKLPYNYTAYVGIAVDAESVGSSIPKRSYLYDGVICRVPSNYDPITATYTGIWDGIFKRAWTDNPAWHLYEMLTNERFGLGEQISDDDIDKYSFYDAAVYNDELVPDGFGGTERRFTFNTVLAAQEDSTKTVQAIAGSFRSVLIKEGSLWRLNQDRPSDTVAIVSNANVIDGKFTYVSSGIQERHTVARVTFNDKKDRYLRATVTYEADQSLIDSYGWNPVESNAYGATTEGQAMRHAKWLIETEQRRLELASWQSSFNQMHLRVGDVVEVFDANYAGIQFAGRIKSVISSNGVHELELDRPILISSLTPTLKVNGDNGIQLYDFTATIDSETSTITIPDNGNQATAPKARDDFAIVQEIKPRLFRISKISYDDQPNLLKVEAIQYDPALYSRVELGLDIPAPVYSSVDLTKVADVTDITFKVVSKVTDEGVRRNLLVSWTPPDSTIRSHYSVVWKKDLGATQTFTKVYGHSVEIDNITDGTYDVNVITHTINGTQSIGSRASYVYSLVGGSGSTLLQPTNLQVIGTTTSTFNVPNLQVEFTNPIGNSSVVDATLKDFVLSVRDTADNLLRTEYLNRVDAGVKQTYLYTLDLNKADNGPRRTLKISVAARDTDNRLTNATTVIFTNSLPDAPIIDVRSGVKSLMIETNRSNADDYVGTIIWASTTSNFTPSDANKIYQGANTFYIYENVTGTWYFKAAHYDSFGSTGLNISSQGVGTSSSAAGITSVTSLPANPSAVGDQQAIYLDVANTSTRGLYAWNGTSWAYTRDGANLIANSVTADKLTVANLAAISANMGNVTAGTLTLDQTGYVRGGATAFGTGTGFWQGYDSGAYKWRVGTPGSSRAEWNGSSFNIYDGAGNLTISSGAVNYAFLSGKPTTLSAISASEASKLAGIANGATNVTNTNQLTDGAALGQTAVWNSVSGANRPLDNSGKVVDGGDGSAAGQRQCNDPPSYYPVGKSLQFKWSISLGIADGGSWVTVETNKQFSYNAGGMMTQWAYAQNGTTYKRSGYPENTSWSTNWVQDLDRTIYTGDLNATYGATDATLNVGAGVNLLPNTELNGNALDYWSLGWNPSNTPIIEFYCQGVGGVNTDLAPYGGRAVRVGQAGPTNPQYGIATDIVPNGAYNNGRIPVKAGQRYEFSAKVANHRCNVGIGIIFVDSTNTNISEFDQTETTYEYQGGLSLNNYNHMCVFGTAPPNAVACAVVIRKYDTKAGQTNSYVFITQPYFGEATVAQTVPSKYSPGSPRGAFAQLSQITPGNASTYIASAAIGSAHIGSAVIGNSHMQYAAIRSANIGDAEVQTLKLAGNAVTVPLFASGITGASGTIYLATDAWVSIIFGGQIPSGLAGTEYRTVVLQVDGVTRSTATAAYQSSGDSSATSGFGIQLPAGSHSVSVSCPGSTTIFVQAVASKR